MAASFYPGDSRRVPLPAHRGEGESRFFLRKGWWNKALLMMLILP
jgi:hypothetical protein